MCPSISVASGLRETFTFRLRLRLVLLVIWCCGGLFAMAGTAEAQGARLNRFRASELPHDDFHLSRPVTLGHLAFGARVTGDYANDPLVYESELGDGGTEELSVVEHQLDVTLGLSFSLWDRLVIFAGVPFTAVMSGADGDELDALGVTFEADGAGLSDVYGGVRMRLLGDEGDVYGVGLQGTVVLPTSGGSDLRGEDAVALHPELLLALRPGPFRVVANVGAVVREDTGLQSLNYEIQDELTFGLGAAWVLPLWKNVAHRHVDLHAQLYGSSAFDDFAGREATALEGTGGVKFHHESGLVAGAAAGPGFLRGFGSPDVRAVLTVGFRTGLEESKEEPPPSKPVCEFGPEDRDGFEDGDGCADPDNDGDGLLDADDQCPNEPEDKDGFEDANGCPDLDNDQDGVLDADDQCPNEPEDKDDFEDANGCPDPDNDNDGVLDGVDECPAESGVLENRGCPDADRDGDTVVDRLDNCPDEPGTVENRGCKEEQKVVITEGKLEILDKVYFRTGKSRILRRSYALLENVASVLNNHPEIKNIQVEGHTDSRGRRNRNVKLSQDRAEAVMKFLVERGNVDSARLTAVGYGPDRPVVPNASSKDEHAQNRRVEFNIPKTVSKEVVPVSEDTSGSEQ